MRDSNGRPIKPTLVFSGTVTATNAERYTVAFTVARVWQGQLRRETTFFVVPVVEGAGVRSFKLGSSYLVTTYAPIDVDEKGTVGIQFGCIDGPMPLAEAAAELKLLGPGRPPQP